MDLSMSHPAPTPVITRESPALSDTVLRVQQLGKSVQISERTLSLLQEINFTITAGERVAIIGRSGSGKSTLLSLLAGLDTPTSGDVTLLGESLASLSEDGRARLRGGQVGFVFQTFQLLAAFTALENVLLPLELAGHPNPTQEASRLLATVGLSDRLHHRPNQLSGGEQQRVALARAFAGNPKVLFADEPTGNLDANTGNAIIDLMFELNQQSQTTLILVTHDPELAARCDRQLKLEHGKLVSDTRTS